MHFHLHLNDARRSRIDDLFVQYVSKSFLKILSFQISTGLRKYCFNFLITQPPIAGQVGYEITHPISWRIESSLEFKTLSF